jgi:hypothetical protein
MASSGALSYRWIFDTGGSGRGALLRRFVL